ncbi:MAG: cellulose biosynthesis cyclic di-GMP-binding regulatory protein BcsB [Salinisphaeraceae bacterium]
MAQAQDTRTIGFDQLRAGEAVRLSGLDNDATLDFGIPREEAVTAATLDLSMALSPALLPQLSHVNVRLNGRFVDTIVVDETRSGARIESSLAVDPRLFADYNQLQLEFIGHYAEQCENPAHSSLWVEISPESRLTLDTELLDIRTGLSALPVPFFDPRDNRELVLPVVFGGSPSPAMLEAAGMLAGWFGMQASYRGARFPVSVRGMPDRHALVLATNETLPAGLDAPPVEQPTVSVLSSPDNPRIKRLLVQGATVDQVRTATLGLIEGQILMTGDRATVESVQPPPPRAVNDVPAWMDTDRPVRLGDLADSAESLQVKGHRPQPITINARIPPDIYTGFFEGVDMDLRYRYTRPSAPDGSRLAVLVNNRFVRSLALQPDTSDGQASRIQLPLLDRDRSRARDELRLPAFQLGADNRLQFHFSHDFQQAGACQSAPTANIYSAIDPDSTIDLTGFPRHAPMPDLALFANAGYPFTRYADLSRTTAVLPDGYATTDIEALLFTLGRLGRLSGLAGTRVEVVRQSDLGESDDDLLLVGAEPDWLRQSADDADDSGPPLLIGSARRTLRRAAESTPGLTTTISARGALGMLVGFESPFAPGSSVVAVAGNSAAGLQQAVSALADPARIDRVRHGVTVVTDEQVRSVNTGHTYAIGNLTWWQRVWLYFAGHPLLLTVLAVLAGLILAVLAFWLLRGVAAARTRH